MRYPRRPPISGPLAFVLASVASAVVLLVGDPALTTLAVPVIGPLWAIVLVDLLFWLFGPVWRAAIHGRGRQLNWGYLGHPVRGDHDAAGRVWLSLPDCAAASGLELEARLDRVAAQDKRYHDVKGWLVNERGWHSLLNSLRTDAERVHKLRVFLRREVWRTAR